MVDEELSYTPGGQGAHLCVRIQKRGLTTPEAAARVAAAAGLPPRVVSWAGLKDRFALASQWLSFPWPERAPLPPLGTAESEALVIAEVTRHQRSLKLGHVRRNRFTIRLRDVPEGGFERAATVLDQLRRVGWPNAFGPQRFGRAGDNVARAQAILRRERAAPRDRRTKKLLMSALQAHIFNRQLTLRLERGLGLSALPGDIMQKHDVRGGMFQVDAPAEEQPRVDRLEISPTGLLPGAKPWRAGGLAGEFERQAERETELPDDVWRHLGRGVRRAMRWPLDPGTTIERVGERDYRLRVCLPSGAYATVLLDLLVQPTAGPFTRTPALEAASPGQNQA